MNGQMNFTNTTVSVVANDRQIKLKFLLVCQVCSILCSLFIMIHIFHRPSKFIKPIYNHFLIVLLFSSFVQVSTELSMVENYLNTGVIRPSTNAYCLFFNWYEFSLNGISLFVMCWASIERHILIFSNGTFQIRSKRILFHYIPLAVAVLYTPTCYAYLIFLYDCVNDWNYSELLCTAPCYYQTQALGVFDWLCNIIIPAFLIALMNFVLIIRVVYRSNRLVDNPERTKKNRKMAIQLLIVSALFLIFWLPIATTGLIQQFFSPTFLIDVQFNIFFYLIYFIQLFLPFVCLVSIPEMKRLITAKYHRYRRRNTVFDAEALGMATAMPANQTFVKR